MKPPSATLTVITGPMFGEKSTELLYHIRRLLRARKRIQVSIPQLDHRSGGKILTHNGDTSATYGVTAREIIGGTQASSIRWYGDRDPLAEYQIVDEAQFFDSGFPYLVQKLREKGVSVICAGLDMDSEGKPFGPMPTLLAQASSIEKVSAVCSCGHPATHTHALAPKGGTVAVGASELYEALCLRCWVRARNRDKRANRKPRGPRKAPGPVRS